MTVLTRYCPACFSRNAWGAARCAACGADLTVDDTYDERLVWALDHPDTGTAMLAAAVLAKRGVRSAIDRLIEATSSDDPYRAAAAAKALVEFEDERARAAVRELRGHRSILVRRAVARTVEDPGRAQVAPIWPIGRRHPNND